MQNTRTDVEKRLARLVAATPPLTTHPLSGRLRADVLYLDRETLRRLNADRGPSTDET